MYKKIAELSVLSVLVISAGGLWGIEQYIDYAPGVNSSPFAHKSNSLSSSALAGSDTNSFEARGEEYYLKNSEQIDADLVAMQTKLSNTWKNRYPLVAESCDLTEIQESFDGNEKIARTVCKPNRIAGVIANRYLDRLFAFPDNRPVMEEMVAIKWALVDADTPPEELAEYRNSLIEYQQFLSDFTTTQYDYLRQKEQASNMNNSLIKGKMLGLEIAFLFAEQEKMIVDYMLGE